MAIWDGNRRGHVNSRANVLEVLDELGIDVVRVEHKERDPWVLAHCPFHEDARPSFAVAVETGHWICYAGCGVGPLAELVARIREVDRLAAERWLGGFTEPDIDEDALLAALRGMAAEVIEVLTVPSYTHGQTYRMMTDRGYSPETLRAFDVGQDAAAQAVVIPVYFLGELRGLVYRYVNPLVKDKYEYKPEGIKVSEMLFGWDTLPDAPESITLVEGPLDAMWLYQAHQPGVACFGAHLSAAQADLLVARTREVIVAFDEDEAGWRGTGQVIRLLGKHLRVRVARLTPGRKDVQDCNRIELMAVLAEAVDWFILRLQPKLAARYSIRGWD